MKKYTLSYILNADTLNYLTIENIYGILSRKQSAEEVVLYTRRNKVEPQLEYILQSFKDIRLVKLNSEPEKNLQKSISSKMVKHVFSHEVTNPETVTALSKELLVGRGGTLIFNRSILSHDGSLEISRDSRMDYDFFFWDLNGRSFTVALNCCIFTHKVFFETPLKQLFRIRGYNSRNGGIIYSPTTGLVSTRLPGSRHLKYILSDLVTSLRQVVDLPTIRVSPVLKRFYRVCDDWLKTYAHHTNHIVFKSGEFQEKLKVTLGAGGVYQKGFLPTDVDSLDITNPQDWKKLFSPNSIDIMLAEHVFEHLDNQEVIYALANCFKYLKQGGKLRIAVPDKFRRDPQYVNSVKPPKDGHKSYFSHPELTTLCQKTGFNVKLLEYFDSSGKFHFVEWDIEDGFVRRSVRFDSQTSFRKKNYHYTSLIIDAIKS